MQNFTNKSALLAAIPRDKSPWVQVRCVCVCIRVRVPTYSCMWWHRSTKKSILLLYCLFCNPVCKKIVSFIQIFVTFSLSARVIKKYFRKLILIHVETHMYTFFTIIKPVFFRTKLSFNLFVR